MANFERHDTKTNAEIIDAARAILREAESRGLDIIALAQGVHLNLCYEKTYPQWFK